MALDPRGPGSSWPWILVDSGIAVLPLCSIAHGSRLILVPDPDHEKVDRLQEQNEKSRREDRAFFTALFRNVQGQVADHGLH